MVYSASMIGNKYGTFTSSVPVEASYFLKRQAAWAVLSYVAFLFFSVAIPHEFFKNKKLLQYGFWGMLILLVIPLLLPAKMCIRDSICAFNPHNHPPSFGNCSSEFSNSQTLSLIHILS